MSGSKKRIRRYSPELRRGSASRKESALKDFSAKLLRRRSINHERFAELMLEFVRRNSELFDRLGDTTIRDIFTGFHKGMTREKIAESAYISEPVVTKYLRIAGLHSNNRRTITNDKTAALIRANGNGMSDSLAAKLVNVDPKTASKHLRKQGLAEPKQPLYARWRSI